MVEVISAPKEATAAAQNLIASLKAPPQAHAVWVKTTVDDKGEFERKLCVSWHPKLKTKPIVPEQYGGYDVEIVPWPLDQL